MIVIGFRGGHEGGSIWHFGLVGLRALGLGVEGLAVLGLRVEGLGLRFWG